MRELTPEELREPDVTVYILVGRLADLPREIKQTLEHFTGVPVKHSVTGEQAYKYILPAYLARELENIAKGRK